MSNTKPGSDEPIYEILFRIRSTDDQAVLAAVNAAWYVIEEALEQAPDAYAQRRVGDRLEDTDWPEWDDPGDVRFAVIG